MRNRTAKGMRVATGTRTQTVCLEGRRACPLTLRPLKSRRVADELLRVFTSPFWGRSAVRFVSAVHNHVGCRDSYIERESNPQTRRYWFLRPACIPVPPPMLAIVVQPNEGLVWTDLQLPKGRESGWNRTNSSGVSSQCFFQVSFILGEPRPNPTRLLPSPGQPANKPYDLCDASSRVHPCIGSREPQPWTDGDLNPESPACKAGVLPFYYQP